MTSEELALFSYRTDGDMALDHEHCFLCGVFLDALNRTVEHVFAKWLQQDFNLWNQRLFLRNGTSIRYRQLTIPSCKKCNEFWLAAVEEQLAHAFREGTEAVRALDQTLLCLWMAKIYYGLQFKELVLPRDRRDPGGITIVDRAALARQSELHHVLQAICRRVRLGRAPGSPRIFCSQVPASDEEGFDYRDLQVAPFLALRIGPTVVVSSLLDWGLINHFADLYLDLADQVDLHPAQFPEVAANAAYRAMRFGVRFALLTIPTDGGPDVLEPVIINAEPEPRRPAMRSFVAREFAAVFHEYTGVAFDDLYSAAHDGVFSTLLTEDRRAQQIDLQEVPAHVQVVPPSFAAKYRDDPRVMSLGEIA
jgi:hypothetical protein